MRIKNERELYLYFWYKTLVISTKYMYTKNKKMSETKICSKRQWYRISRESYGTIFASISNWGFNVISLSIDWYHFILFQNMFSNGRISLEFLYLIVRLKTYKHFFDTKLKWCAKISVIPVKINVLNAWTYVNDAPFAICHSVWDFLPFEKPTHKRIH